MKLIVQRKIKKFGKRSGEEKGILVHGTSTSRGTAVLIKKEYSSLVKNVDIMEDGRTIVFDIQYNDLIVTVAAIYAPNDDKPEYFRSLAQILRQRQEHKIVVGDFNLTLDVDLDRKNTFVTIIRLKRRLRI